MIGFNLVSDELLSHLWPTNFAIISKLFPFKIANMVMHMLFIFLL